MDTQSLLVESPRELEAQLATFSLSSGKSILIQLFSDADQQSVAQMAQLLIARFPAAELIGMSCEQLINQGEIELHKTLIILSSFTQTRLSRAVVPYQGDIANSSIELFKTLQISGETRAAFCLADRLDLSVRANLDLFSNVPDYLSVAGGASCATANGQWVLSGTTFYQDVFVAVALHNQDLFVDVGGFTEWYPIGKTFMITEAKGQEIISVDNEPIQTLYNRYLGNGHNVPFDLIQNFPFLVGDESDQTIYSPIQGTEQGTVLFDRDITEGEQIRFCYDHPSLTLEQVYLRSQVLYPQQPQTIFVYNCTSRLNFMEGNSELQPLQNIANTFGTYCMGEICRDEDRQRILHHSMTFMALREGEIAELGQEPMVSHSSYMGAVSPLFSLIRNSLLDLDEHNQSMARQIKQQAEMLTRSYRTDRRTGLPNRSALRQRLAQFKPGEYLLSLKLANFSQINEKYGYLVGDKLLQDLTEYFKAYIIDKEYTDSELFAIGIGEWALVFKSGFTADEIHHYFSHFADKLENVNFEPFGLPDIEFLSVSVNGGLVSRNDFINEPIDSIMLKAVEARRYAYQNNKRFCDAKFLIKRDEKRIEQLSWLSFVSRAIMNDNVLPYAQPILNAHDHTIASYECLVRIQDEGEIILPGRFLPIIEGTHLYTRLSRQMITRTFELMASRSESFSINLAPQDFMSERTLEHLERAIKSLKNPGRVGIEVLETEQIKDYAHMIDVCNQLRNLGASIIIDDFGSGYSNIDEIIKLEPQVIKLDGSLIRNIDFDLKQRHITQQLIQLCHVLEAKTVAEFVHNAEICRIVENMGIDYLQGFHLAEPAPIPLLV